ncbi:MAG: hypothetical protein IKN81_03520 [Oscillospiraceae bacterium]|nr:hypothetical protein [Oscillospiraceae bacterium]
MAVHRIHKKGNFTQIPNSIINDGRLSYAALGLLVWILSLIDKWHFTQDGITGWNKKYGRRNRKDSIKTALHELISAGYLYCPDNRTHALNGQFADGEWEIFEDYTQNPHYSPQAGNPPVGIPEVDTPAVELPPTDNATGIKTISIKTNSSNTLLSKTVKNQSTIDAAELAAAKEEVERDISYDEILSSRPESVGLLDVIVHEIASVELSDDAYVRIGKEKICREKAVSHYYALTAVHVIKVIDSIEAAPSEIKHLNSYVRKALYNAVQDFRTPE